MNIAFLTSEYVTEPYFAGGLAQYLGRVTPALVERENHVEVFVTADHDEEIEYKGVIVHRVKISPFFPMRIINGILRRLHLPYFPRTQKTLSIAKGLDNALRQRMKTCSFDVVQAASWEATGLYATKNKKAPVVIRISSYEPLWMEAQGRKMTLDNKINCLLERNALRWAKNVYAPSRFLADYLTSTLNIRVDTIRPPFYFHGNYSMDYSGLEKLDGWPDYLLFYGRIDRYKGAGLLSDAAERLIKEKCDFRLALAGDYIQSDADAQKLINLTKVYPECVKYLGTLPQSQLRPVIRNASAVVLPSLIDNLPNTCLEAMAMGKVVVGPNGVSFDELIVDGQSGLLFKQGCSELLHKAILNFLNMADVDKVKIEKEARKVIDTFGVAKAINVLDSYFRA